MKLHNLSSMILAAAMLVLAPDGAMADTFGTGANQFNIDFVPISGATNPTSGYGIVNHAYRMGTYEITNDQWNKFTAAYGTPTGTNGGYSISFFAWGTGTTNVPTNDVSWYEAAQFVNWLNTSTNHQAAYKFTGTPGDPNSYTFATWDAADAAANANGTKNPYRNKDAYYFLPTEDEWVKAAYWNGTTLQTYATKDNSFPAHGNGSGTGWNYGDVNDPEGPWTVGSGSQELNGTYDMMGNIYEWMENPYGPYYYPGSMRVLRGGDWLFGSDLTSSSRLDLGAVIEDNSFGFRVASVPEPGSITLLVAGAIAALICWRRRK